MAYATAEELRGYTNKQSSADDTELTALIAAAEQAINEYCNRPDGFLAVATATARVYAGSGKAFQMIDECVEISLVEVKDSPSDDTYTAWVAADWIAFRGDSKFPNFNDKPYNAIMTASAGSYATFTSGHYLTRSGFRPEEDSRRAVPTVRVTAKWGYAVDVPPQVKSACLAQAARWYKRFEGSFQDALASTELGALAFRLQGKGMDADIAIMLYSLKLPTAGSLR